MNRTCVRNRRWWRRWSRELTGGVPADIPPRSPFATVCTRTRGSSRSRSSSRRRSGSLGACANIRPPRPFVTARTRGWLSRNVAGPKAIKFRVRSNFSRGHGGVVGVKRAAPRMGEESRRKALEWSQVNLTAGEKINGLERSWWGWIGSLPCLTMVIASGGRGVHLLPRFRATR